MEKELFTFIVTSNRAPYILAELGNRVTSEPYKIETDRELTKITFLRELDTLDLLSLFHAGVKYGYEHMAQAWSNFK